MRATRIRYLVVASTALMAVLLYLDRFCISFAETFIKEDLGLTDRQVGWMLSAFFWTYALGQVPSGWLTDRFGSRIMLTVYILMWSLFTGLTGAVSVFAALLALRFGFGLAQAGAYPTGASIVSKWVPFSARGTASSVISVGGRVGGFLALFATGYLIVWLTPSDVRTAIVPSDIRDGSRLCYELAESELPAAEKVLGSLTAETRQLVVRQGAAYAEELERIESRKRLDDESRGSGGLERIGTVARRVWSQLFEDDAADVPQVEPLPDEALERLAAGLTRVVDQPGFFTPEIARGLPLESEARRLLAQPPGERSRRQSRRMNRLILEGLHRDSLKAIYGAGWRPMMWTYGGVGLFVAALVWWASRDRPARHPWCNRKEVELIEGDERMTSTRDRSPVGPAPVGRLLTSRSMWLICASQWFTNVGWVFVMTWAPRYFDRVHQVPVELAATMVAIPPFVGWFGMVAGGVLTDKLVRRVGLRWGRALPMSLSRFLAMGAYLGCLFAPSPWFAVAMFSIVTFSTDLGTASVWAFKQDVGGRYVGSILGWGNMWGNLGAAVAPPLVIAIVGPQQDWNAAFVTCAAAFLLSGLCALGVDATIPIAPEESEPDESDPDDADPDRNGPNVTGSGKSAG